jgi:hypothetical protein
MDNDGRRIRVFCDGRSIPKPETNRSRRKYGVTKRSGARNIDDEEYRQVS